MFEVKVDMGKNLIVIKMSGHMEDDEMLRCCDTVIKEAKKLKPNFTAISDISTFKPASPEGAVHIQKAQKFLVDNGAGKFIRVIENALGRLQFNRNAKTVGLKVIEVGSMEEAKKLV